MREVLGLQQPREEVVVDAGGDPRPVEQHPLVAQPPHGVVAGGGPLPRRLHLLPGVGDVVGREAPRGRHPLVEDQVDPHRLAVGAVRRHGVAVVADRPDLLAEVEERLAGPVDRQRHVRPLAVAADVAGEVGADLLELPAVVEDLPRLEGAVVVELDVHQLVRGGERRLVEGDRVVEPPDRPRHVAADQVRLEAEFPFGVALQKRHEALVGQLVLPQGVVADGPPVGAVLGVVRRARVLQQQREVLLGRFEVGGEHQRHRRPVDRGVELLPAGEALAQLAEADRRLLVLLLHEVRVAEEEEALRGHLVLRPHLQHFAEVADCLGPALLPGVHLPGEQGEVVVVGPARIGVHVLPRDGVAAVGRLDARGADEGEVERLLGALLAGDAVQVEEPFARLAVAHRLHVAAGDAVEEVLVVVLDLAEGLQLELGVADPLHDAHQAPRVGEVALLVVGQALQVLQVGLAAALHLLVGEHQAEDPEGLAVAFVAEQLVARLERREVEGDRARGVGVPPQQERNHGIEAVEGERLEVGGRQQRRRPVAPQEVGRAEERLAQRLARRGPVVHRQMAAGDRGVDVGPQIGAVGELGQGHLVGLDRRLVLGGEAEAVGDVDERLGEARAAGVLLAVGDEGGLGLGELAGEEVADGEVVVDRLQIRQPLRCLDVLQRLHEHLEVGDRRLELAHGEILEGRLAQLADRRLDLPRGGEGAADGAQAQQPEDPPPPA